jgi:hypothetical protein
MAADGAGGIIVLFFLAACLCARASRRSSVMHYLLKTLLTN